MKWCARDLQDNGATPADAKSILTWLNNQYVEKHGGSRSSLLCVITTRPVFD